MRPLILLACAVALLAGEAADPQGKAQAQSKAKALWLEAAKASDVWTCLQLEAWGRTQQPAVRLNQVLADSVILGDPLFAFAGHVRACVDLGERLLVTTDGRIHVLAPDGRPVQRSVALRPSSEYQDIGWDGAVVASGVGWRDEDDRPQQVWVACTRSVDGTRPIDVRWTLKQGQHWDERLVVADDASALAVSIFSDRPALGAPRALWITRGKEDPEIVDDVWRPLALGAQGAWLVAHEKRGQVLIRGKQRTQVDHPCRGPGVLACFIGGKPVLIKPDGSEAPLQPGCPIGRGPRMESVGAWLALSTGGGAKVISGGDLLGDNAGTEVEQPDTVVLWRWADLAADPAAKPVASFVTPLSRARQFSAALWAWDGVSPAVDLIDLSGSEPKRSRYLDAPAKVGWVWNSGFATIVDLHEKRRAVYDPAKREIWSGPCDAIQVKRRDLLLTSRVGKQAVEWQLQHMSSDPAARSTVVLDLPRKDLEVRVGYRVQDYIIATEDSHWWQVGLDGKRIAEGVDDGPQAKPAPRCWEFADPAGRWFNDGCRIYTKEHGRPEALAGRMELRDAWRFGQVTVLIDQEGGVIASGRKRSEWTDLGKVAEGRAFGLVGKTPVILGGDDDRALRAIIAGPKLAETQPSIVENMPPGPWRVEGRSFVVPKGKQYTWDGDRLGFGARHLRSPDGSSLLVVTSSLLIELDPDAAKTVGR